MKKLALLALGSALLTQGCNDYNDQHSEHSKIFGKVNVIDERGRDISDNCNVDNNRIYKQKAEPGQNMLGQITCTSQSYLYRIKPGSMFVTVPDNNSAVYFGDITISLSDSGYDVKIEDGGNTSTSLYKGSKTVRKSLLQVQPGEKNWVRNAI